ncbi:MAG: flagellar hook-length control protein FliK [Gammaproteobacteria bacterium]
MIVTRSIATNYDRLEHSISRQRSHGALKPGQVIDAVALSNSRDGHVNLRIGNAVIAASTNISLQKNTHLLLEVVQTHPQLLLRLIPTTAGPTAIQPLQDAITNLLPRQDGLAPSLAGLIHKVFIEGKSAEQQKLRVLLSSLLRALPGRGSMAQAEGLRQAMLHSGLFLEAMLSRLPGTKRTDTSRDIKACLSRLLTELEYCKQKLRVAVDYKNTPVSMLSNNVIPPRKKGLPIPQERAPVSFSPVSGDIQEDIPDLIYSARAAIARLGLLQVCSAENFNNGEYLWQLEIPVKHTNAVEIVSISIEKDQKNGINHESCSWIVNLAVNLPELGPIQIRVSVFEQGISSCFWPESTVTGTLIHNQFERLRARFEQQGISTLNLSCQVGSPATPSSDTGKSNMDLTV